jgi:division protein CdvB (Snf7/Vps24/ESCRT-III family)
MTPEQREQLEQRKSEIEGVIEQIDYVTSESGISEAALASVDESVNHALAGRLEFVNSDGSEIVE